MMQPMLCQPVTLDAAKELVLSGEWVIEEKYDGVRAYIEDGKLYDRRGKEMTQQFPEFEGLKEFKMSFDGEIVAQSGKFNDISGRVHLRDRFLIRLQAKRSPAKFMVFDVVGAGYAQQSLDGRREVLEKMDFSGFPWMVLARQYPGSDFATRWNDVLEHGKEGLVLKRRAASYQFGKRAADWLKLKAWEETTATFTKLEVHPKGVRLETEDGHSVNVNGVQAEEVIARFRRDGVVLGEVQYLPQRESSAWRFPSWRGVV
jgi:ATP-dependent DNA ligase